MIPGIKRVTVSDGDSYWNAGSTPILKNEELSIREKAYDYSFTIDIFIQNPMQFSKQNRMLFQRGNDPNGTSFNFRVALKPDVNDLIVSVQTTNQSKTENILIPNIPVQEPFRLGVILSQYYFEAYLNGKLIKTKAFQNAMMDIKGNIYPMGTENIATLRNLTIWPRILSTAELNTVALSLPSASTFHPQPIPPTPNCPTQETTVSTKAIAEAKDAMNAINAKDALNELERLRK
jgi:hypothetical protein